MRGLMGLAAVTTVLALGTTGCENGVAPDTESSFELEDPSVAVFQDGGASFAAQPAGTVGMGYGWFGANGYGSGAGVCDGTRSYASSDVPLLGELVRTAYDKVRSEQGDDAAEALVAALRALHQEAFEARRDGDRDAFFAKMEEAHREAARIVVDVLGTDMIPDVLATAAEATDSLAALIAQREADGADVTRLQYVLERAEEYLAAAETAWADGDAVTALDYGTRALQAALHGGGRHSGGQANGGARHGNGRNGGGPGSGPRR